jgi:hypothetical protein
VKILKYEYKDLKTEIQHTWNVKTKVIPVILGATGTISIPEQHTGKDKIKELQKKALLGTAHLLWDVLMYKYKTFNMGNNMQPKL